MNARRLWPRNRSRDLEKQKEYWDSGYDWAQGGEDWSEAWGGTAQLWWGSIFPRIHEYLPAATVLEIAPGFGRCTQFLVPLSKRLILVDIAQRCIDVCRERFSTFDHIEYHVNDGASLAMVEPDSVDFMFSYDSLVHAPQGVLDSYLGELPRILKPNGVAFIHHSNLAEYVKPWRRSAHDSINGRDTSASAEYVRKRAVAVGASCFAQELVTWGADSRYSDCFSVVTMAGSSWDREPKVVRNPNLMKQAEELANLKMLYGATSPQ